jgi:hypothetical protein
LGKKYNKKLDNLPNSLTHLTLGWNYNQKLDNLPNSLTHLTLGYNYNQKLDNLPNNLTHLTLGWDFNQELNWNISPGTHTEYMYNNTKIGKQLEKLSPENQVNALTNTMQQGMQLFLEKVKQLAP